MSDSLPYAGDMEAAAMRNALAILMRIKVGTSRRKYLPTQE
jgi:hypothetical protein